MKVINYSDDDADVFINDSDFCNTTDCKGHIDVLYVGDFELATPEQAALFEANWKKRNKPKGKSKKS
ncbi:MAG: hypothetical protein FWD61_11540 [Phycisphaerales bacterium]|nr:hypothetical protein [Phycisphaerales bacterium]